MTQTASSGRLTLVRLAPEHAADAARLHILGQPGAFLTSLGADVLTVLYRTLPQSPVGFGFAAIDPARPQQLRGFVSATTSVGALFAEMGTRRLPAFLPPLLRRFVGRPALAVRATQTVIYPFLHPTPQGTTPPAELLSIMVEPALRSVGVGALLVMALFTECQQRGVDALDVTVDAANVGAQRFYVRHGFTYTDAFTLYGRAMYRYRAKIAAGSTRVQA
ncbi:MAG TPA: GNAT family N-acetyltransferase [Chloroflexi bacterium]|nr:GNAT family N-acetyltransferase [Chloroflexota bacterium]